MYKRMLRSALAVVFSAIVACGAVGGAEFGTSGAVADAVPPDTGWHDISTAMDTGWHIAPARSADGLGTDSEKADA
ncbi:hypothetical protein [Streptomyces sp. NPDC006879]|uniref:hypothetical protein n=1 Tax=Streptomyces sp. NPDC006879 TaxID=3364767 RepID=UPI0036CAC190